MTSEPLVKRLAETSYSVRCNPTYTSILEDRAMDRHIVIAVMHDYARARGFSSLEHMERFLTPPPPPQVNGVEHESTVDFVERRKR